MFNLREIRDNLAKGLDFSEAKKEERQTEYQQMQQRASAQRVRPVKTGDRCRGGC